MPDIVATRWHCSLPIYGLIHMFSAQSFWFLSLSFVLGFFFTPFRNVGEESCVSSVWSPSRGLFPGTLCRTLTLLLLSHPIQIYLVSRYKRIMWDCVIVVFWCCVIRDIAAVPGWSHHFWQRRWSTFSNTSIGAKVSRNELHSSHFLPGWVH